MVFLFQSEIFSGFLLFDFFLVAGHMYPFGTLFPGSPWSDQCRDPTLPREGACFWMVDLLVRQTAQQGIGFWNGQLKWGQENHDLWFWDSWPHIGICMCCDYVLSINVCCLWLPMFVHLSGWDNASFQKRGIAQKFPTRLHVYRSCEAPVYVDGSQFALRRRMVFKKFLSSREISSQTIGLGYNKEFPDRFFSLPEKNATSHKNGRLED